jgi:hypothetical protein
MDVEYQLSAKRLERNVLATELDEDELWGCEEYQRLEKLISELQARLNAKSEVSTE